MNQPTSGTITTDLTGQIAIVTGASRGLGRGIALALARCGAKIACVARNPEKLDDVLKVLDIERETWQTVCDELGLMQTDQQTSAESHTSDVVQPNKLPDIGAASSILPPIGQANLDSPRSGVSFEA